MASVKQPKQQVSATRAVQRFTVSGGKSLTPVSTSATAPATAPLGAGTPSINIVGNSTQTRSVIVPPIPNGQKATINVVIPLPEMPSILTAGQPGSGQTPATSFISRTGDRILFQVNPTVQNLPAGVQVVSISARPQARAPGTQLYTGPTLPGGQKFTTFSALVSIVLSATATSPTSTMSVTVNGQLTLQQGQGGVAPLLPPVQGSIVPTGTPPSGGGGGGAVGSVTGIGLINVDPTTGAVVVSLVPGLPGQIIEMVGATPTWVTPTFGITTTANFTVPALGVPVTINVTGEYLYLQDGATLSIPTGTTADQQPFEASVLTGGGTTSPIIIPTSLGTLSVGATILSGSQVTWGSTPSVYGNTPAIANQGSAGGTGSTSMPITLSGGAPIVGQRMVAYVSCSAGQTMFPPTGWNVMDAQTATTSGLLDVVMGSWYRDVVAGDGTTYTWTCSGSGLLNGWIGCISGAIVSFMQHGILSWDTSFSPVGPPIVPYAPNSLILAINCVRNSVGFTAAAGWSSVARVRIATSGEGLIAVDQAPALRSNTTIAGGGSSGDGYILSAILAFPPGVAPSSTTVTSVTSPTSWLSVSPTVGAVIITGLQMPAANIAPGSNTQILQTVGGVSVWANNTSVNELAELIDVNTTGEAYGYMLTYSAQALSNLQRVFGSTPSGGGSTNITTSACQAGSLLLAYQTGSFSGTIGITAPTGFNPVVSSGSTSAGMSVTVWQKIAVGGETTFTFAYSSPGASAGAICIEEWQGAQLVGSVSGQNYTTGNPYPSGVTMSLSPVATGSQLIACANGFSGSLPSTAPGYSGYSGGSGNILGLYEKVATSSGSQTYPMPATSQYDAGAFFYIGASSAVPYSFTKPYTMYTTAGAIDTAAHGNSGAVTAAGITTTITLTGSGVYTTGYRIAVWDQTAFAFATVTAQSLTSFTFTSITGHVYFWDTEGI
jgi:hypothetical protein